MKVLVTRTQTWTLEPVDGESDEELKEFLKERYQAADTDDIQIERLNAEESHPDGFKG